MENTLYSVDPGMESMMFIRYLPTEGPEVRLTDAEGLDDGPEYTPDGQYIYFNSNRTGTMQIWRMKPDGSAQEPVTTGEFHDWFAHISPDGKWIQYLSFLKEEVKVWRTSSLQTCISPADAHYRWQIKSDCLFVRRSGHHQHTSMVT